SITLIPISILMYRAELGAANPASVFIPILLATSISTIAGFLSVAYMQKISLLNKTIIAYTGGLLIFIASVALYFNSLPNEKRILYSAIFGNFILFAVISFFIAYATFKKINVYESFINGAKEGFEIAVKIIPYLVAMLTAIAAFRASGLMQLFTNMTEYVLNILNINTDFVPALPTAIMKPLSGSGARAMMIETLQTYGPDSFEGFVSSVIQGSTETTFYVLAVYFGAVKIMKIRHALPCALFADFMGILSAIVLSYIFY
ncbi:MAG: spore maturation protein, partial [Alphaproteobacteria bacterium]|nr:spore maturation protein [Alphaproteobacteria bacterium]